MKLSFVKLVSSSYDPRKDARHPVHGVTDFDAADGYEMELRDGYVTIAHSGRTALYSLGKLDHALQAEPSVADILTRDLPPGLLSGAAIRSGATDLGSAAALSAGGVSLPPTVVSLPGFTEDEVAQVNEQLPAAWEAAMTAIAGEADAARETLKPPDMTPAEVVASIASAAPERKKKRRR